MPAARTETPTTPPRQRPVPASSAQAQYAARRSQIDTLLATLGIELNAHQWHAQASPADWGRVGDLGIVRMRLIDALSHLSGLEPEAIQKNLDAGDPPTAASPAPTGATA